MVTPRRCASVQLYSAQICILKNIMTNVMKTKYRNLICTILVYVYFQIMVNVMGMNDFNGCCHQEEYLQDIDCHSRDSGSFKQYLEGVLLWWWLPILCWRLYHDTVYKRGLLFMYTSYFYFTGSRSKMRLKLWNDSYIVCDILV